MTPPLVSTQWLADRLGRPELVVLDASWFMPGVARDPEREYLSRHIPGAARFDIDAVSDRTSDLPHMLPTPADFTAAMRRLGVNLDSTVVVYDSAGLFSAPRVWWTLRAMGLRDVFVLDGGLPRWLAEGRPVEDGHGEPPPGTLAASLDRSLVRDLDTMRAIVGDGSTQIIDARPAPRFSGAAPEPRAGLRGGHMPGAINVPWSSLVRDDALREPGELHDVFESAGVRLDAPIVTTCGSGVSAAVVALALARLGRFDIPVYDGSWTEWGGQDDTPVVTGP